MIYCMLSVTCGSRCGGFCGEFRSIFPLLREIRSSSPQATLAQAGCDVCSRRHRRDPRPTAPTASAPQATPRALAARSLLATASSRCLPALHQWPWLPLGAGRFPRRRGERSDRRKCCCCRRGTSAPSSLPHRGRWEPAREREKPHQSPKSNRNQGFPGSAFYRHGQFLCPKM